LHELTSRNYEKTLLREGLGTAYEYFVKKHYLENLVYRLHLRDILEVHYSNSHADGMVLAPTKCMVVVVVDCKQSLKDAKLVVGETPSIKHVQFLRAHRRSLPFNSNAFDLVLNLGDVVPELLFEQVLEMTRVSKRFVLVFVPNRIHIGDIFFRLYLRVAKPQSGRRHHSFRGLTRSSKRTWNWSRLNVARFIHIQSALEDSLPKWIKATQAHIIFALGLKTSN